LISAEAKLWREVLVSALWDVAHAKNKRDLAEAVGWFATEYCDDVCQLVGRDPVQMRRLVGKLVVRGNAQRRYWFERIREGLGERRIVVGRERIPAAPD